MLLSAPARGGDSGRLVRVRGSCALVREVAGVGGTIQKMLAEKMGCTQQYISKVLKEKKNMSLETICKIENVLGIEIIKT